MKNPNWPSMVIFEEEKFLRTDAQALYSQMKQQKKLLQRKRRWILRLPLSKHVRENSKEENDVGSRSLLESIIREDDIFYDTLKSHIEEAFGVRRCLNEECQVDPDDFGLTDTLDIRKAGLPCLDSLTTKGLCILAKVLTRGQAEFEKTRWKLKEVVRESFLAVYRNRNSDIYDHHHQKEISRQITRLLNDPENFKDNRVPFMTSQALVHRIRARKILAELEKFKSQTVLAMHAILKKKKQSMPQLKPKRSGLKRDYLIKLVRKISGKMLSKIGKEDQLPVPLAKAMQVASLSLKLMPGFHNYSVTEFHQFSQEIKDLQNEIIKAVWVVKTTEIRVTELKIVKSLLGPNVNVSIRSMRKAVSNMLTEYLFKCGDIGKIPESLSQTLALINKKSNRSPDCIAMKNKIDEEIECVLNVSADLKQNLLDLIPENDFEAEFTDAYMEDLEDSEDEFNYYDDITETDDLVRQREEIESTGDSVPVDCKLQITENDEKTDEKMKSVNENVTVDETTTHKNRYLAIQGACDETSLLAYDLVGRLLKEFADKEGLKLDWRSNLYLQGNYVKDDRDSPDEKRASSSGKGEEGDTVLQVTKELIPSFSESKLEKLRKLLGP